jgi:hypothetical protein
MLRIGLLFATAIGAFGCSVFAPKPLPTFRALVVVEGDPGQAISGARISFKNREIGVTDEAGRVELALRGRDGQVFDLGLACPEGYSAPPKPLAVTVRKLADARSLPEYRVQCSPLLRTVVVAVRAVNGPNLPVVFLGRERTRTDESGAAHIVLQVPPNQAVQVKLDTSGSSNLRPASPVATFDIEETDDVIVLEQRFEVERKVVRGRRGGRSRGPTPL